jgi:hypothetical protein
VNDDRAWRDWSRTEDCIRFGFWRWAWFALAAFLINKYVDPQPVASVLEMLAFGAQVWWIRHDDARRARQAYAETP